MAFGREIPNRAIAADVQQAAPIDRICQKLNGYVHMRTYLLYGLLFYIVPMFVSADEFWSDKTEGFGAMFPVTPEKVGASTSQTTGHAYQSAKGFQNGGALYAITVVSVPSNIKADGFQAFLEGSHNAFVQSMGGDSDKDSVEWLSFGAGRERLAYNFDFIYSGIPFTGQGFWIMDKGRAIRVSVSYMQSLTSEETEKVLLFPESFVILTD